MLSHGRRHTAHGADAGTGKIEISNEGRVIRVGFLITRGDHIGGAQIHVRDLASGLRRDGHDVVVGAGTNGDLLVQLEERNVPTRTIPALRRVGSLFDDVRAFRGCRDFLRDVRPDILSTHSSKAGMVGRVAARSLGIPVLFTAHGWGFSRGRPYRQRVGFSFAERIAAPFADRIVTVCRSDRTLAVERKIAPARKIVTVLNGMVDIEEHLRATPGSDPPNIVSVARLSTWKGHPTLFDALHRLRHLPWTLDLVGDGPLEAELEAVARGKGLADRVRFLGYRRDVPEHLARAQIFVLASRWEGFPRSILEAMRSGLPTLATDVGGVSEAVMDGETGYVVPPEDSESLASRLETLITDPEGRRRMGAAARRRYEELFTFDRMLKETVAVYEDVVSTPVAVGVS